MKLLLLFILTTITVSLKNIFVLLALLSGLLILTNFTKAKAKIIPRLKPLLLIGLLVILFQVLFNRSLILPDRLFQGAFAALRILTLSLLVFYYTAITSTSQIVKNFSFLPQQFQLLLTITLSLIPVIFDEASKISLIQQSRGNKKNKFLPVVIPLLHRTLKRAEQIALVMECRREDSNLQER